MFILNTDGKALEFHGAHITENVKYGTPFYHVNVVEYGHNRVVNGEVIYSTTNEATAKQLVTDLCTAAGEGVTVFHIAEWEAKGKGV